MLSAKPSWLKVRAPSGDRYTLIKKSLRERQLHTVCEEARCPNLGECWGTGTATLMLLGDTCTRRCHFCAVKTGNPLGRVDSEEPSKVAQTVELMNLKYVVLTTVDRDDLPDFGASHLAKSIHAVRQIKNPPLIEMLTGDFRGRSEHLKVLCEARPDVFSHNLETVARLTPEVRDRRATFSQSLRMLLEAEKFGLITKSGLMLGLGETKEEIIETMKLLRDHGVKILTLGQYLQPSPQHRPVSRYVTPEEFNDLKDVGLSLNYDFIASGPLVRSSYRAAEHFIYTKLSEDKQWLRT